MPASLRFGIVGLGIASTQIVPEFAGRPHLQLTAAADVRPDAVSRFEQETGGRGYASAEALCASPDVDAVYICSPNHLHAEHVILAAEHGKHAIVEKPMALSLAEAERMNEACERHGVRLLCGHTHSFDPPVRAMRAVVRSGELGRLAMLHSWHYNEFMYRPRMPHELDPATGGNVIYNQGPHQVDIVRLIAGGLVRSVRGATAVLDPSRRAEGAYTAFLEFEDGTPATLVYNGYGHFDTAEFTDWVGEQQRDPYYNLRRRQDLAAVRRPEQEWAMKEAERYGGRQQRAHRSREDSPHSIFGFTLVSCERGDLRQSPQGLVAYTDDRRWDLPVPKADRGRVAELEEMYRAVVEDRPAFHDGRWGEATLEVVLAIMQSAAERREIRMEHQVPSPE